MDCLPTPTPDMTSVLVTKFAGNEDLLFWILMSFLIILILVALSGQPNIAKRW